MTVIARLVARYNAYYTARPGMFCSHFDSTLNLCKAMLIYLQSSP